jgi:CBS domain containing-hemolysin-like protein
MNDPLIVTLATIALIALSAFFVIIEFALLGARGTASRNLPRQPLRPRRAARHERPDADAGRGSAGHHRLHLRPRARSPSPPSTPGSARCSPRGACPNGLPAAPFALALFVVTFLHLVVGEMAPKSWAIAHPETSALAIGIIRAGLYLAAAPAAALGQQHREPPGQGQRRRAGRERGRRGQDIATIRQLVEHSAKVGHARAADAAADLRPDRPWHAAGRRPRHAERP